jgi:hypothetical protein
MRHDKWEQVCVTLLPNISKFACKFGKSKGFSKYQESRNISLKIIRHVSLAESEIKTMLKAYDEGRAVFDASVRILQYDGALHRLMRLITMDYLQRTPLEDVVKAFREQAAKNGFNHIRIWSATTDDFLQAEVKRIHYDVDLPSPITRRMIQTALNPNGYTMCLPTAHAKDDSEYEIYMEWQSKTESIAVFLSTVKPKPPHTIPPVAQPVTLLVTQPCCTIQ